MSKKRYISRTGIQYTFPVRKKDGRVVWVSFKGNDSDYTTSDKEVQTAIEASGKFKNKEVGLVGEEQDKEPLEPIIDSGSDKEVQTGKEPVLDTNPDKGSVVSYGDVTDINGAVAILRAEPYSVHHLKLRTPAMVMAQAAENKVAFPNWKVEE